MMWLIAREPSTARFIDVSINYWGIMNKDQVKGEAKDIAGKIQEEAGKMIGSTEQQAKGLQKQTEG